MAENNLKERLIAAYFYMPTRRKQGRNHTLLPEICGTTARSVQTTQLRSGRRDAETGYGTWVNTKRGHKKPASDIFQFTRRLETT